MKTFEALIEGTSPLLLHRFSEGGEADPAKGTRRVHLKEANPRDEAEKGVYRDLSGGLYFPTAAIARLLREAGSAHKQRGSRKSLKFVVPAAVRPIGDAILLYDSSRKTRLNSFEIDARSVVIPATKGRIMRYRARCEAWVGKFSLSINDDLLAPETVHRLLTEGGMQIGVGDFRPEKGGPFGTFQIVGWDELSTRKAS